MLGIVAVIGEQVGAARGGAAQHLVADVERGVRPRALGEVLDHLAHPLLAVDENDVARAEGAAEGVQAGRMVQVVTAARLHQGARGEIVDGATEPAHGVTLS